MEKEITILRTPVGRQELERIVRQSFGDFVKAVVDIEEKIMAIGGDLHSDEEALLLDNGSRQANLWGINLYPGLEGESMVEFDSMINLRPSEGNRSRGIDDERTRNRVIEVVRSLVKDDADERI
jgi:hypothetical protein